MTTRPEPLLWLNDARGVYIPRDFANCFVDRAKHVAHVTDEDWSILKAGPDHDYYWETWDIILQNAIVTDDNGISYRLDQNGDLWLIPVGMEWSDKDEWYVWPETESVDE